MVVEIIGMFNFLSRQKLPYSEVLSILHRFNNQFNPSLEEECSLDKYAKKISEKALLELCFDKGVVIGYIAYYENYKDHYCFITSFAVDSAYRKQGIAQSLFSNLLHNCNNVISEILLEVAKTNFAAISFYTKMGFIHVENREKKYLLKRKIK